MMKFKWLACGMILLAAITQSCSSSKKKTKAIVSPAVVTAAPSSESIVIDIEEPRVAENNTAVAQSQTTAIPNTPFENISQPVSTPEREVAELHATGIQRNYDFAPTIHYDLRKPQFVMIHHTSQNSIAQTIRTFQLAHTQVSSHYVIGRDGQVVQMLNDYQRAWHAGAGKWGNITDMNSVSIGIELDNNGSEPFPDLQINALLILLNNLKSKYRIPQTNFIGHSDYAPGRKDDPSTYFPWETLADRGFGIWYNANYLAPPPATFNSTDALRIIGYDTSNLRTAVRSFKKKYIRTDLSSELTPYDIMVLYDLYRKFY
ncbi:MULTISPECIES: N-acetylmuramoyl-L-alanine amidase [Sphingobacterium]|uniref:N-acetylmuramoyl-L-alanine amidase n=1 Tax=Sphingobacterium populi TaxID=1812824 RepID=A0ABW5UAW7_9SPHI|nr:N-acetylmuramoyl-L-alanine amidase [Sphingobacterium sp. CFCC 11742]